MPEAYKQKDNVRNEIGERSAIRAVLCYAFAFIAEQLIFLLGTVALIGAGGVLINFHILPTQEICEILGIVFISLLCITFAFFCTKTGSGFLLDIGKKVEESVNETLQALQVLPFFPSLQVIKFIHSNEASDSFIPSSPFIPPRLYLA